MMYYRIYGKAVFPQGIAPGEEKGFSNIISAARNGENQPLLRGTSIAGALRAAFTALDRDAADVWFGCGLGENGDSTRSQDSRVYVADMPLCTSVSDGVAGASEIRTHNLNNRHTGSVVKGGLFSLEAYPPNTSGDFLLYVEGSGNVSDDEKFADLLGQVLGGTLYLGGNRNRGIGYLELQNLSMGKFDTSTGEGMAQWMNVRYEDRLGKFENFKGESFDVKPSADALVLNLELQIPRGEDFVIGYGTSMDNLQSEPQFAIKADGRKHWRIPGSAFRGIFRGWMNRLAARDGLTVSDSADRFAKEKNVTGEMIGTGFVAKDQWADYKCGGLEKKIDDPIVDLFGSMFRRGRIHFGDAYSEKPANDSRETQLRMHVAIDRFSGGANEGGLFGNKVLVGDIKFNMQVSIENPSADEKKWLLQTIKALDLGVISVGSSKGSGLLQVNNMAEVEKTLNGGV